MRVVAASLSVAAVSAVAAVVWWRTANIGAVQRGADLTVARAVSGATEGRVCPHSFPARSRSSMTSTRQTIRMPAWRGRLSHAQVDDLVTYVRAVAAADVPEDPAARNGRAVAERLGCFGPGGRGAGRNPGSLKGYIPPWDGNDFAELVADDGELREWILGGRPQRLQANALARFFLDRQAIRMPAFRGQLTEEELRALEAYIGWLREPLR